MSTLVSIIEGRYTNKTFIAVWFFRGQSYKRGEGHLLFKIKCRRRSPLYCLSTHIVSIIPLFLHGFTKKEAVAIGKGTRGEK